MGHEHALQSIVQSSMALISAETIAESIEMGTQDTNILLGVAVSKLTAGVKTEWALRG